VGSNKKCEKETYVEEILMKNSLIPIGLLLSSLLAGSLSAQNRPRGIYAKINVSAEMRRYSGVDFESHIQGIYKEMLDNSAVSGLLIQEYWADLNPNPQLSVRATPPSPYDWTYLDDAFAAVLEYNTSHPDAYKKTIQLTVAPGFQSPQWLLDELPSCDGLFERDLLPPPSDCGRVTFTGFVEKQLSDQLPLPWNTFYKNAWRAFLEELNVKYGSNPLLVSISVSGPTAASEEMILPNDNNCDNPQTFPVIFLPPTKISPNDMWLTLLQYFYPADPTYQNSDQAFIDEWNNAIDMFGHIFSGLTLVATTGSGLPNFTTVTATMVPSVPINFANDCGDITLGDVSMDCAAETSILSHFAETTVGGSNAKAVQTSGVEVSRADQKDLGIAGVKLVSALTASFGSSVGNGSPADQILGGAQFNTSVENKPNLEGSAHTVEQALYNLMQVIFTDTAVGAGTAAGGFYCEPVVDEVAPNVYVPAPLNYLQIYFNDFQYAEKLAANSVHGQTSVNTCKGPLMISAEQELINANFYLLLISEPELGFF
jgi:hypothetical protein